MSKQEWYEDDRPRDLSKYLNMSKEELDKEIEKEETRYKEKTQHRNVVKSA